MNGTVRRPDEFAAGHIPNAINLTNESIGTAEIPGLPDKDQLLWSTAEAADAVKRRPKSWSSWATRTSWISAGFSIGRARLSQVNNNTAVNKEKG